MKGPQLRPLLLARLVAIRGDGDLLGLRHCGCGLCGGNGELAVFDVNVELLTGVEADIVYQPAAGDLEPEVQRLAALVMDGSHSVTTDVALALHGDEPFRDGWTCFKIGVSHDQLLE